MEEIIKKFYQFIDWDIGVNKENFLFPKYWKTIMATNRIMAIKNSPVSSPYLIEVLVVQNL